MYQPGGTTMSHPRNTTHQARMRATIKAARPACHICGKPINYTLTSPHPESFVIDHVIPLAKGGEDALSNVRAAHRLAIATAPNAPA